MLYPPAEKNQKLFHKEGSADIEQWIAVTEVIGQEKEQIPYTFYVKGYSMYPLIRSGKDAVTVVRCNADGLRRGDIILFRSRAYDLNFVLHRIYRIEGEKVQTLGDGNLKPDPWINREQICAKAVRIQRGELCIMPQKTGWRILARIWMRGYRFRRLPIRALHKLGDWKNRWKKI